ncbi:MAG TPA: hypothetical protein VLU43_10835 [Anaeromyxobacteraceae bacterium]|nr:hypothetical protein [Anaeromyxobacteraceae bacterium]
MMLFYAETACIALALLVAVAAEYLRTRDTLHPLLVLGPMLLFLYVLLPAYLDATHGFFGYLSDDHLALAQGVNLLGVLAIVAGVMVGGRGAVYAPRPPQPQPHAARLTVAALVLGLLGVAGFVAGIVEVGGFTSAYGQRYGGGWSESGYARELYHLTIPALLMLLAAGAGRRSRAAWLWVGLFALPLAVHGALGARRGPLFVVLVTVLAGRYLIRRERPRAWAVLAGGAALGVLLLLLVANRDKIYIGSELDLDASPTEYIEAGGGNEFIYGAGTIVATQETNGFAWGGRYATVFFVRPVPRAVWPSKYEDAARWFGTNIEVNLGIDVNAFSHVLGWRGAIGAAPGVIADMWVEFAWGGVLALFAIGFLYGYVWKRSVESGGLATVVYSCLLCLSLYLVMQTLEAMAFRFLVMVVPAWIAWRLSAAQRGARA